VAGLARARAAGTVAEGERVVCVLTGHGLKDPDTATTEGAAVVRAPATLEALERIALS
jgi:threonine synthase